MPTLRPFLPRQRLHARCSFSGLVARSRAMDMTDELWQQLQEPEEEPELVFPTAIYPAEQVLETLVDSVHQDAINHYKSFYSSVIGGITTHPAFMNVPMDDHMVHRGHAVFDTAIVAGGHIYQLDQHVERFMKSAELARIPLPTHEAQVKRIIMDTAAASCCESGFMRFWLSVGRGNFDLSTKATLGTEMYCIFYNGPHKEPDITKGWKVKPSPIPNKPGMFSELKSVNYLQNALNLMDAQDGDFDQGIFVHPDGTICEGPNLNFAIVKNGVVHTPEFKECLRGCTMQRILDLIPEYAEQELLEGITGWKQGPLTVQDIAEADEAFMSGGSLPVMAVTQWDGRDIGDGTVGVQALAIRQMIVNDIEPREDSGQHTQVPYGMLTGMPEDM